MKHLLLSILVAAALLKPLPGAVIVATNFSTTHTAFDGSVSATDLVNFDQTTFASKTVSPFSFGPDGVNDGNPGANATNSTFWSGTGTKTVTFNLNTTLNPFGYDITTIRSLAGWDSNSTTHANQIFALEVSLVGSATFLPVQSVNFAPFTGTPTNDSKSSIVTLTDSSGVIVKYVDQVRFTYQSGGGWGNSPGLVIKEIDVVGLASISIIPEPSLSLLSLLGIAAFGLRRRR